MWPRCAHPLHFWRRHDPTAIKALGPVSVCSSSVCADYITRLYGHNMFNLQTSTTEARLAPGSTEKVLKDWCTQFICTAEPLGQAKHFSEATGFRKTM